jgi:hypothetical protein
MFSEVFQYDTPIASREYTQRTEQLGVARSIVD